MIMRDDAENRLGQSGIGCNITEVTENYGNDGNTLRLIRGTFTTPHYMENEYARSPLMRGESGDPQFVENREVDFSMLIPRSLADNNTSGPLTVFGHGLFGSGSSYVRNAGSIANEYQTVVIATDFKGWSRWYQDAMTFALLDLKSSNINRKGRCKRSSIISPWSTITGICSDLVEFKITGPI